MSTWSRLVRFTAPGSSTPLLGEPVDAGLDVGLATSDAAAKPVEVNVYSGTSILDAGQATGRIEKVGELLSVLKEEEVGTIRCIGLNVSGLCSEIPGIQLKSVILAVCEACAQQDLLVHAMAD